MGLPSLKKVWEKSPARWSRVGTVAVLLDGLFDAVYSNVAKKNVLFFLIGPPNTPPT